MRQFNLQEAKQGAEVCTVNGDKVRILCYDGKANPEFPIVALVDLGEKEKLCFYDQGGRRSEIYEDELDLRMKDGGDIIKTWEDIPLKRRINSDNVFEYISRNMGIDLSRKMIATAKIDRLIDLSYGGKVRDEDWENPDKTIWVIVALDDEFCVLDVTGTDNYMAFLAFHSSEYAHDFLKFNRNLVEDYYQK